MVYSLEQLKADFSSFRVESDIVYISIHVDAAYRAVLFIVGTKGSVAINHRIERALSDFFIVTSPKIEVGNYLNFPEWSPAGRSKAYPVRVVLEDDMIVGIGSELRDFFILFQGVLV